MNLNLGQLFNKIADKIAFNRKQRNTNAKIGGTKSIINGGSNNTINTVQIITQGTPNDDDVQELKKELEKNENLIYDKELLSELKKDLILNINKLPIKDIVLKALAIANIIRDKNAVEWLNYELTGYNKNFKKEIPEYRKIYAYIDLGITNGKGYFLDLRKDPIHINYGGGAVQLSQIENKIGSATVTTETLPIIREFFKKFKTPEDNIPKQLDYIINHNQITRLLTGLRSRIQEYIIKIN